MGREKDSTKIRELITELRKNIPNLSLRTTFMVGFPEETDKDFGLLIDFVKEIEFEHLGAFRYSDEEETKAYRFAWKVPVQVIDARYHTLMSTQSQISLKNNQKLIGSTQKVLVESTSSETGMPFGRTSFQALEIDGIVYLHKGNAVVGEMVEVKVTDASEYDLHGEI